MSTQASIPKVPSGRAMQRCQAALHAESMARQAYLAQSATATNAEERKLSTAIQAAREATYDAMLLLYFDCGGQL